MRRSDIRKTEEVVEQLIAQLTPVLYDIGFLDGTVDNPIVSEKIGNSFSGHAPDTAIRAVAMKVVLFITRSWEKNANSIPNFIKFAGKAGAYLESNRKQKHPDWPESFLEIGRVQNKLNALERYTNCFVAHPDYLAALRHRNENLAHLLKGKSDISKRLVKDDLKVEELTYRQVLTLGKKTAVTICKVEQIWRYSVRNPEDWIRNSRNYTKDFWKFLPILSKLETDSTEQ